MIPPDSPPLGRLRPESHAGSYPYLLSLPDGYAAEPKRAWPLLLFLHGAAYRGSDLAKVTQHGLPRLLADAPDLTPAEKNAADVARGEFVVVMPQCPHYEVWDDAHLLSLLNHTQATLRIDPARVYLVGLSMGGFGAWSLGMRRPERFAALVAICGGGRLADITAAGTKHEAALRTLGVWAFHGAKDGVVPLEESQRMIDALKAAGHASARLTVYPDAGHDAWTPAFADPELYTWLLGHKR